MAVTLTTPNDICNYALAKIGFRSRIGSLYDGSMAAKKALDVYGQTRDSMLRYSMWNFAQKEVMAVLAGVMAPYPWISAFIYPIDAIQIRMLKPVGYDPLNPIPSLWVIGDDPVKGKVIWSYFPAATLVYTAQVTDPAQWDTLFLEAFAGALGKNLKSLIETDANMMKLLEEIEVSEIKVAAEING
jgi:hypothetical protein